MTAGQRVAAAWDPESGLARLTDELIKDGFLLARNVLAPYVV